MHRATRVHLLQARIFEKYYVLSIFLEKLFLADLADQIFQKYPLL